MPEKLNCANLGVTKPRFKVSKLERLMNRIGVGLLTASLIASYLPTDAFELDPYSKWDKVAHTYSRGFVKPVHENLTLQAIAASSLPDGYKNDEFVTTVIKGVRWNDDPLNMIKGKLPNFYLSFRDSCKRSSKVNIHWDLLYRTHCGDMQFLHAMASKGNEKAESTKRKILMWLEYSFKVSTGEIESRLPFKDLNADLLEESSAAIFNSVMTDNNRIRLLWTSGWLFSLDCSRVLSWKQLIRGEHLSELKCVSKKAASSRKTQDVALGSFLHLLQDSFSDSHVMRENRGHTGQSKLAGVGRIIQFGNYSMQLKELHKRADEDTIEGNSSEGLDLMSISAKSIELSVQQRLDGQSRWLEMKNILDQAFDLVDPARVPGSIGYK